jgi:acyl dehydratase
MIAPIPLEDILNPKIGHKVSYNRTFTDDDIRKFAHLSGDDNPIHLDEQVAKESIFGQRVVHGMLTGAMFTMIFGKYYPGPGGIYLDQQIKFLKPIFIDQPITVSVELIEFHPEKRIGTFNTNLESESGKLLLTGTARVLFPAQPA